jgi:hypothetical protein
LTIGAQRAMGGLWEQFKKELAWPRPTQTTGTTTATLFQNPSGHWPPLQGGVRPFTYCYQSHCQEVPTSKAGQCRQTWLIRKSTETKQK